METHLRRLTPRDVAVCADGVLLGTRLKEMLLHLFLLSLLTQDNFRFACSPLLCPVSSVHVIV